MSSEFGRIPRSNEMSGLGLARRPDRAGDGEHETSRRCSTGDTTRRPSKRPPRPRGNDATNCHSVPTLQPAIVRLQSGHFAAPFGTRESGGVTPTARRRPRQPESWSPTGRATRRRSGQLASLRCATRREPHRTGIRKLSRVLSQRHAITLCSGHLSRARRFINAVVLSPREIPSRGDSDGK